MKHNTNLDILKHYKRSLRDDELREHLHPVGQRPVIYRNKKKYTRKSKHKNKYTE